MARFLRTADGGLINSAGIDRIDEGERKGLQWQARATLKDGGYATLSMDKAEIENALLPVVAAAPGYVRLRYFEDGGDDGGPWVDRMPVVAWRIAEDVALPVTPDEDRDDALRSGVLLPDGRVVQPFMQTFPDEDAWRGEMDRQVKKAKAMRDERPRVTSQDPISALMESEGLAFPEAVELLAARERAR